VTTFEVSEDAPHFFPLSPSAFFQDDLFPPTRVFWEPTMTAEEWMAGARK
jgi:coronin-7